MLQDAVRCAAILMLLALALQSQAIEQLPYSLSLNSEQGQPRVQARRGQIRLIANIQPRLSRKHQIKIESDALASSIDATEGLITVSNVPRGVQTFHLVVSDKANGQLVQKSSPLVLDIRRYIPR